MSDVLGQTDQRTCRFPGCFRVVVPAEGVTGRPPEYCDDPGHTRAAAWRARRRLLTQETTGRPVEEDRPVDAARQRASEIRGQVAGMGEHLVGQLHALVEELRTLADPDGRFPWQTRFIGSTIALVLETQRWTPGVRHHHRGICGSSQKAVD